MMTRKDYEAIAAVIHSHINKTHNPTHAMMVDFIAIFKKDNPLFDEKRFIKACVDGR